MNGPTTIDYVLLSLAAGLWLAVLWRGIRSSVRGELWWSCVGLAVIVTMKIGIIAEPFNEATGRLFLQELVTQVAAVTVATLTASWQNLVRYGERRRGRNVRVVGFAAIITFLMTTWFAAPIYDIPADSGWIPESVLAHPVMGVHWLVFVLYMLAYTLYFLPAAWAEARDLPRGYLRTSLWLLIAGATVLVIWEVIEGGAWAFVLAGTPFPPPLMAAQNLLLVLFFLLFLLAVSFPLISRRRRSSEMDVEKAVASLWSWIDDAGRHGPDGAARPELILLSPPRTLLDQIIDIRDGMHRLQRHVAPSDLAVAGRQARRQGLFGAAARAFMTAACLQLAADAVRGNQPFVDPPPANLQNLGGGRTERQEAHWLASVYAALANRVSAGTTA